MSTPRTTGLLKALRQGQRTKACITPSCSSALGRRHSSHGEHYNEPSGLLFSELVRMREHRFVSMLTRLCSPAKMVQSDREKIGNSSGMLAWAVASSSPLESTILDLIQGLWLVTVVFVNVAHAYLSISTWALEEAKARLEARGDAAKYIPSADSRIQQ